MKNRSKDRSVFRFNSFQVSSIDIRAKYSISEHICVDLHKLHVSSVLSPHLIQSLRYLS
jgi:hypothetical protein